MTMFTLIPESVLSFKTWVDADVQEVTRKCYSVIFVLLFKLLGDTNP